VGDKPVFVQDIDFQDTLYGVVLRSPIARGILRGIEAPRLSGSYSLLQAEHIPGKNQLDDLPVPVFASERISYIGEPVGLLIGPDLSKLEEYAGQCRVAAAEEPPVLSAGAGSAGSPLARRAITLGDPERVFAEAKTVVEGVYRTGIQEHWYAEAVGAAAVRQGESPEGITVYTATQWPFQVRRAVAAVLNLPPGRVRVEPSPVGIHLDGKLWYPSLAACHAALGAFITRKPVKIALSREEDFRYSPKRNGAEIHLRSALGERGQILGIQARIYLDMGAQGVFTDEILDRTCLGVMGLYKHGAAALEASALRTNVPPAGPFAGFGLAQGFFAMERHASRIADTLRQDPAEWRKNNVLGRGKPLAIAAIPVDSASLELLLDTAVSMGDYRRKWASYELLRSHRREQEKRDKYEPLRGIGIAAAYQGSGFLYPGVDKGVYGVELTLDKEGFLEIKTGMVSSSQEYIYIWQRIAAEILGIEAGMVRVIGGSTDEVPDPGPASLSRNSTVVTHLVERACNAIRKQRFRDPLPITVRRGCRPGKLPNWEGKPLDQNALNRLSWGTAVVEVEIDPIEYVPKIRGVWLGVDGGRILSESRARRSLTFSVIQALGWASREKIRYEAGRIPPEEVNNYDIPAPAEIPPIHIDFIWNDTVNSKGIGELPFSCVPAAYVQAVSQAMDYPFEKIPLTGKDIWEAEKSKEKEEPR
jgi:CO/xanthine dehydrogenase Mo-binding subunit